jgi:hypothetical protein
MFYVNLLLIHALTEADIIQELFLAIRYTYLVLRTHSFPSDLELIMAVTGT